MSIDLILEVMDHAPADLTSGERLALIVIAERANDKTRLAVQSSRWTLDTIAHRAGVKRTGLKSIFQGLARKGCEVRVPVKTGPDGKHVFAFEGTAMTFKVPRLAKRGGQSIPTERGGCGSPTDGREGMPQHPRGEVVASERGGHSHPQSLKTLKEPSKISLSNARTSAPPPRDSPDEDRERDDSASSEDPNLTWHERLVIEANCPPEQAAAVVAWIQHKYPDRGPGWWRKLAETGDLAEQVREALDAIAGGPAGCARCGGSGKVRLEEFGDTVACGSCPSRTVQLDQQPRTSQRGQLAPRANLPDGVRAAGWERRRSAEATKAAGWLALPGQSRQLHNSHDNPDRYDEKL